MIEISLTEIFLLIWAVGASALYIDARNNERIAKAILQKLIEDEGARNQVVEAFEKFKKEVNT